MQLYRQQKNATMSPEERAAQSAKQAQARKLSRQQKNATMSPEERAAQKAKQAQARKLSRQQKNAAMSPEEKAAQRAKKKLSRQQQKKDSMNPEPETSGEYEIPVDITGPVQQAIKRDQKQIMKVEGDPNEYRAAVCVLCDRLIIGCESIHKITAERMNE